MTKSVIWICEKMIHAYVSIWRCLKSAQRVEMETISASIQRIYERRRGGLGGASPPEANGMLKKSNLNGSFSFSTTGWGCGGLVVSTSDSASRMAVLCP